MNYELIKSADFCGTQCDIYSDDANEIFMTAFQLGSCLGYSDPMRSICRLVSRNKYLENTEFSSVVNLTTLDNKNREVRIFTEDGIYEVTMLAKTEKAKEFRAFVRQLIKSIRKGETFTKDNDKQNFTSEQKKLKDLEMRIHMSDQLLQLAKFDTLTKYNKNILIAKAAEILLGEPVLSFDDTENDAEPVVQMYSASEIGKMLGTTPQKIGRLANRNNMKTSEYGKLYNCTLSNGKNVNIFQYYQKAIDKFRELLKADNSEKSERKVESETNADIWTKFKKSNGAENI